MPYLLIAILLGTFYLARLWGGWIGLGLWALGLVVGLGVGGFSANAAYRKALKRIGLYAESNGHEMIIRKLDTYR